MSQQETIEHIQKALGKLSWYYEIEADLYRILGLVQSNQDFFGNPPAGESCIKLAADKLEELIKVGKNTSREPVTGDEAVCRMCGETIRYVGPYWEHLGELQPRHPAWPKEQE